MRKMQNFYSLTCGVLFTILCTIGCKSDDGASRNAAFDPNQPVKFHEFLPDSGGIRTKLVIKGSNFGNDKSKVRVFFKDIEDYEREAIVLGLANDVIYTIVPKQADGKSTIRVNVEGKDAEPESPDQKFRYTVATSVSTVVGRQKDAAGHVNGTLSETTFADPRYLVVDDEENITIQDQGLLRLVSIPGNKSITINNNGITCEQPFALDKTGKSALWVNTEGKGNLFLFDAETGWSPEVYGQPLITGDWISACILDPIDSTYIIIRQNTGNLYTQPFKKGIKKSKGTLIGNVFNSGSNSSMVYNKTDGYVYCTAHNAHAIFRFKFKKGLEGYPILDGEVEEYMRNGLGASDGSVKDDAKMNAPRGIAVDSEGNLYVADAGNHAIRKIDTKTNIVTTIAGKLGQSGYADGDPLKEALFNQPFGVFIDKEGSIYIGDSGNRCIRKLAIE